MSEQGGYRDGVHNGHSSYFIFFSSYTIYVRLIWQGQYCQCDFFFEQRWTVANRRDPIFDFFSQTNSAVWLSCSVKQSRSLPKRVNPSNKRGATRALSVKSKSTLCDFLDQKNNLYSFDTKIRTARSKLKIATNFIWRLGHGVNHRDSILPLYDRSSHVVNSQRLFNL